MAKRPPPAFALLLDESLDSLLTLTLQALHSLAQLAVHPAPVSRLVARTPLAVRVVRSSHGSSP
jgi:hypothetical protein